MSMSEEGIVTTESNIKKSGFDIWYDDLCEYAYLHNGRVPYKMAWADFYERGFSVEEAVKVGPYISYST
ncbi:hypothetical protein [Klebsiella pneumoniae]|uniref:hypothetical protein n=1 Tax=Klebsiella pneumoniae TaxID=573 RepID=UPI0021636BC4|nr:hypothetical protein [Klebsiella pneumoniae]MCJ6049874.1 hypothetical protein [Klebsiella pneumoniae]MDZ2562514.1 hypothetical protein [Klebsiella pneumoniae]MDZ2567689.1 hypothetical protein [Klebsiella pneumoniae]